MRNSFAGSMVVTAAALAVFSLMPVPAVGQTASAIIPRTADGHPDLSGIWQVMNTAAWDIQSHAAQKGVPAGMGVVDGDEIPYTPAAAAKKKANYENRATLDPDTKCYLPGVPRVIYMPFPFQIVQTPTLITVLFEYAHAVRNIFMNTAHPPGHIDWWMGDSRGRWEGDTLVIDVTHFHADTWFDRAGNFHSEELHLVERLTPSGPDRIDYEVTIEDPRVFTRPWKMSMILYRHAERNLRLLEYECYSFEGQEIYKPIHTP
jgi:hypothetical protein